jgi:hypothetical protein
VMPRDGPESSTANMEMSIDWTLVTRGKNLLLFRMIPAAIAD